MQIEVKTLTANQRKRLICCLIFYQLNLPSWVNSKKLIHLTHNCEIVELALKYKTEIFRISLSLLKKYFPCLPCCRQHSAQIHFHFDSFEQLSSSDFLESAGQHWQKSFLTVVEEMTFYSADMSFPPTDGSCQTLKPSPQPQTTATVKSQLRIKCRSGGFRKSFLNEVLLWPQSLQWEVFLWVRWLETLRFLHSFFTSTYREVCVTQVCSYETVGRLISKTAGSDLTLNPQTKGLRRAEMWGLFHLVRISDRNTCLYKRSTREVYWDLLESSKLKLRLAALKASTSRVWLLSIFLSAASCLLLYLPD